MTMYVCDYVFMLIATTAGSWLPNVLDETSGTQHTTYFVSITLLPANYNWQLTRRYTSLYNLYCSLKKEISKAFPSGMTNSFPNDRVNAWIWGMTDKVRDKRREALSKWFQELLLCQNFMLNLDAVTKLHEFIEIDKHLDKIKESKASGARSRGAQEAAVQVSTILTQPVSERYLKRKQDSPQVAPRV